MTERFLALGDAPTVIMPGYKPLIRSMPELAPLPTAMNVWFRAGENAGSYGDDAEFFLEDASTTSTPINLRIAAITKAGDTKISNASR